MEPIRDSQPTNVSPQQLWDTVNRFTNLFNQSIYQDDFEGSCQQAFALAINACEQGRWTQLAQVREDIAKLTLCWKTSLLNHSISQGEDEWTKQLIAHKINLHSVDFEGNTALHSAAKCGAVRLIDLLCNHIEVDLENNQKQTPLHIAIEAGHPQFAEKLIEKGANVNRTILIGSDAQITLNALGLATMRGEKVCIDLLIKNPKCDTKFLYHRIGNLLHVAIYFHQFDALHHLLHHYRTQFDIESKNQEGGLTPLSYAASLGEQEAIYILHHCGASIDAKDYNDRLPIHHAAIGCHHDSIQLLASLGSDIDPIDHNLNRPLDLVRKIPGDQAKSCESLLMNLSKSKEARKLVPSSNFPPPVNLVFKGGGPKGLAFIGALTELQEKQLLQTVERVAGTSAGAITASLVAINYPIGKLDTLLRTTDLATLLLDHPLSKKKLSDAFSEATKDVSSVLKTLLSVLNTCLNPLKIVSASLKALYQCTGICDGEVFREWLEELIQKETKTPFMTFGELAEGIKKGKPYKHLHVYGTKVGKDPKIIHIHSNDPEWKDVIISDAVRLSMSIPGVFKPHIIHIKSNGSRIPAPQFGSFLDGGMLYNFPVETFDQKQFFTREDLGKEGNCPKFNKRTLGFSLFSSLDTTPVKSGNVNTLGDLLLGICRLYVNAEDAIRQLNPYNISRVIEIDVKDVGTLSFNMSDSKKNELVKSGKETTRKFLQNCSLVQLPDLLSAGIGGISKIKPNASLTTQPEKFSNIEFVQKLKNRKLKLENLRKNNPKDFPDYFDKLLEGEYLHLYDHLIEMRGLSTRNNRLDAIKKKSFSLLSHVVIETKQVIIQEIENSIPQHCPNILFLLGGSGAGKSTSLCFLRGDEMVLKDFRYESKSDKNFLIGHEQATSCTFLPRAELVNDWLIVDFPGFDDSSGPLISLGMECALKALISKHQPKVLIIESITNTEGRFAAAAQLGARLTRLLDKKEECVLGITKYSKDHNFGQIKAIEEQQIKERSLPTTEENQLTTEINLLSSLNQVNLQSTIKQKQERLKKIQEEKALQQQIPLPDSAEKVKNKKNLQETEDELLKQIGLTKIIRFDDLQNSTCLPLCFADLSQSNALHVNAKHPLDPDHGKLIEHLFLNNLLDRMKQVQYENSKFENFEESVKKFSLIYTIFSQSNPEIGDFFHLPEIDPSIVRNYDKRIVGECIDKYMKSVILKLDIAPIKVALKEMKEKADKKAISELENKFTQLEKYVMGVLGINLSENENSEEIEAKWMNIQKDIAAAATAVEKDYALPMWATFLMGLPIGIPLGIYKLRKWKAQGKVEGEAIKKIITDCSKELEEMHTTLIKLKELEQLVKKRQQ